MLSSLQGLAIVGVRITGINHEFSTIPHVKEDVIDILLNLKQVIFTGTINEPTLARLKVKPVPNKIEQFKVRIAEPELEERIEIQTKLLERAAI